MRELFEQTTTLVRQELELTKLELPEKGKQGRDRRRNVRWRGSRWALRVGSVDRRIDPVAATAMTGWLAASIVAVVYGAVAGVLALSGKYKVQQAVPPVPEQATESVKEDVQWTKTRAKQGRN